MQVLTDGAAVHVHGRVDLVSGRVSVSVCVCGPLFLQLAIGLVHDGCHGADEVTADDLTRSDRQPRVSTRTQ